MMRAPSIVSLGLVILLTVLVTFLLRGAGTPLADDFFIHFRIARNWNSVGIPYFNLDEPALATSAPLYTALIALLLRMSAGAWLAALTLFQALGLIACCATVDNLVFERGKAGTKFARLFLCSLIMLLLWDSALGGMETSFALWGVAGSILLYRARSPAAFLVAAATVGIRLECAAFLAMLLTLNFLVPRVPRFQSIAWSSVSLFLLVLWVNFEFGTLLPQTVVAKRVVYQISRATLLREIPDFSYLRLTLPFNGERLVIPWSLVLCFVFTMLGLFIQRREWRQWYWQMGALFLLFGTAVIGAYVGTGALLFFWYVPLVLVPFVMALFLTLRTGAGQVIAIVTVLPLATHHFGSAAQFFTDTVHKRELESARVLKYLEVGARIARCIPNGTVAAAEIGGLGAAFPGPIRDGIGLASPSAVPFHPLEVNRQRFRGDLGVIPLDFITTVSPDAIVTLPRLLERGADTALSSGFHLLEEPVFLPYDTRRGRITAIWQNSAMWIFTRRIEDIRCIAEARDDFRSSEEVLNSVSSR